jgi:hypothetical protein
VKTLSPQRNKWTRLLQCWNCPMFSVRLWITTCPYRWPIGILPSPACSVLSSTALRTFTSRRDQLVIRRQYSTCIVIFGRTGNSSSPCCPGCHVTACGCDPAAQCHSDTALLVARFSYSMGFVCVMLLRWRWDKSCGWTHLALIHATLLHESGI